MMIEGWTWFSSSKMLSRGISATTSSEGSFGIPPERWKDGGVLEGLGPLKM